MVKMMPVEISLVRNHLPVSLFHPINPVCTITPPPPLHHLTMQKRAMQSHAQGGTAMGNSCTVLDRVNCRALVALWVVVVSSDTDVDRRTQADAFRTLGRPHSFAYSHTTTLLPSSSSSSSILSCLLSSKMRQVWLEPA